MKFRRKFKKTNLFKRSNQDLSIKLNEMKKSRLSLIKKLTWRRKKNTSMIKFPSITSSSLPRTEELENKFMLMLEKIKHQSKVENIQQTTHSNNERLLMTRSIDDFPRITKKYHLYSSFSSQSVHNPFLNKICQSNISISKCGIKIPSESIGKDQEKKNNSRSHDAAIIEFEYQSYPSFTKSLEKSHSSPLPMNTNYFSMNNNQIESAHIIDQYSYENKNEISVYSCVSEMGIDESIESFSMDEERVKHNLLQYNQKNLRHRWSFLDIWETTMTKLPLIFNCIWRKQVRRTGSREFLLEYDQGLSINNNNQENFTEEQRYVEQERPINSHIGLALLSLLIFPPVGILAMMLSIWSLCGQQDRHLSRKFGNTVYCLSIFSICLSFLLLISLFTYFTYRYLSNPSLTPQQINNLITKDIEYT